MGVISSRWAKKGESQQVLLELVLDSKGRTGSGGSREREGVSDSTDRGWDGEGHAGVCGLQASVGGAAAEGRRWASVTSPVPRATSRPTSYPGIAATLVFSHILPGRLWAPTWISARASWLTSLPEPTADRRRWTPRLRFLSRASPRGPLSNVHFCWLPSSSVSLPRPHPPAPWDAFPNDGSTKPLPRALLAGTPRLKRAANVLLKNLSFVLRTQKIGTFPR